MDRRCTETKERCRWKYDFDRDRREPTHWPSRCCSLRGKSSMIPPLGKTNIKRLSCRVMSHFSRLPSSRVPSLIRIPKTGPNMRLVRSISCFSLFSRQNNLPTRRSKAQRRAEILGRPLDSTNHGPNLQHTHIGVRTSLVGQERLRPQDNQRPRRRLLRHDDCLLPYIHYSRLLLGFRICRV